MLKSILGVSQVFLYQILKLKILFSILLFTTLIGCAGLHFKAIKKQVLNDFTSEQLSHQHTGFLLVDIGKNDTLFNINGAKYFIPASTTKLFTYYTSLKLLGDSLPSLKYAQENQNATILGTGDPTWLHPYFKNELPIDFLKRFDSIYVYLDNYEGEKYGPGWAWEDYPYYFSPEISAIPLYGNVVTVTPNTPLTVIPDHFATAFQSKVEGPLRDWKANQFYLPGQNKDTLQIPYITSKELTVKLLSGETGKPIGLLDSIAPKKWKILPGIPRDSVLKQMLWESDNFLAEQLMLLCSSKISDTLSFERARDSVIGKYLGDLDPMPRWVDGSGLSRYNLFTPAAMVSVLKKLYMESDSLQLFTSMPQWDSNGTISHEGGIPESSFIYAKSGSMGNIYNLCGYLRTKSGKILLFSFMNNHFRRPSRDVRQNMYAILKRIHETY